MLVDVMLGECGADKTPVVSLTFREENGTHSTVVFLDVKSAATVAKLMERAALAGDSRIVTAHQMPAGAHPFTKES